MERSVLQGLAAFRWGAWLWMAGVLLVSRDQLARPWLAITLAAAALAVTVLDTVLLTTDPERLVTAVPVLAELAVGAALVLCDGLAYGPDHAFSTSQSLGSVWPLSGILGAGVALGPLAAAIAGAALGMARLGATALNGAPVDTGGKVLSLTNTVFFYALGGAAAGYVARLLRRAEREISAARAREEVARTLHDGVLQTLAVVERRTDDPALARLAREQERELREYLFGLNRPSAAHRRGAGDLGAALRSAAARCEDAFGLRVEVIAADDLAPMDPSLVEAIAGAAGEAVINAAKHGRASKVVIYVEPAEGARGRAEVEVFCSVKDDGCGFDVDGTPEGVGLSSSIRARMADVGGRVEVTSALGRGTEVCMWAPR